MSPEPLSPEPGAAASSPATTGETGTTGRRFDRLVEVMDRLRSPGGCAWDGRQSHESLLKYLIEEAYEVVEAVEAPGGPAAHREDLVEELGDVLLQVVFHARVAQERGAADGGFGIDEVVEAVTAKLIRRHPQVFDDARDELGAEAPEAALHARWEDLKRTEKPQRTGAFDGIPPGLPALQRTEKILAKARRRGLEPPTPQDGAGPPSPPVTAPGTSPDTDEELGAVLFELVRSASARGLDAEGALRRHAARWAVEREVSDRR